MDAPDVKIPHDKRVLLFGGAAAVAVLYWWWHRAPAAPPDPSAGITPSSSDAERVPGPGASGDSAATAPPDSKPVDDAAWAQLALTTMSALGFEPTKIATVTGKWLSQETISSPSELSLASLILARVGFPPSGLHPVLGSTAPSTTPPPDPTPAPSPTWHGPLTRKTPGGSVLKVKVQLHSTWEWWVLHEYNNIPPDVPRRKAAAAKLKAANAWRGRAYSWDTVSPPQVLDIPSALYV